jgi:hypothetical protein
MMTSLPLFLRALEILEGAATAPCQKDHISRYTSVRKRTCSLYDDPLVDEIDIEAIHAILQLEQLPHALHAVLAVEGDCKLCLERRRHCHSPACRRKSPNTAGSKFWGMSQPVAHHRLVEMWLAISSTPLPFPLCILNSEGTGE